MLSLLLMPFVLAFSELPPVGVVHYICVRDILKVYLDIDFSLDR